MDNRRMFQAFIAAMAVFLLYSYTYNWLFPPPKPPPARPTAQSGPSSATSSPDEASTQPTSSGPATTLTLAAAAEHETFSIGGGADDALQLDLTTRGAAVERLLLTTRNPKKPDRYRYRETIDRNEPYSLLTPITDPATAGAIRSFETNLLRLKLDGRGQEFALNDLDWEVIERSPRKAVFAATLREQSSAADLVRVLKSFELSGDKPLIDFRLTLENVGQGEIEASLIQDGPVGFPEEGRYYATRHVMTYSRKADGGGDLKTYSRRDLLAGPRPFPRPDKGDYVWTAVVNKYFGVFMRPVASGNAAADFVQTIGARIGLQNSQVDQNDLIARIETRSATLAPGQRREMPFEVYAGSKNTRHLREVKEAFVDRASIGYVASHDPDKGCCPCQFEWVNDLMMWALNAAHAVTGNYGIAILLLVVVIRLMLHPLSVFQQKSMYRMQESMGRIQPRLAALREKYPNDKARQNQEQMKIYGEEGVNPAAPLVGMIPVFLQMPILIGLWTALNTDVNLRHAPFDGWWIRDLSAPDALIQFSQPITIPILGWLPVVGTAFSNIPSLNVLPILMGIGMFLQQKYMPKPAMAARQEALKQQAATAPTSTTGMTPEEQMRQQQMMMNMMSILFPIMFYYQPSGLALYWMAGTVFAIFESLRIRKQIAKDKERRAALGPQKQAPKKPGLISTMMKKMAQKAEEFQKKAEEITRQEEERKKQKEAERKKDRRGGKA
jgi:YidC/Oxa1 family membrane protein insertase